MSFAYLSLLVLVVALGPIFWFASRRRKALGHSQVGIHGNLRSVPLVGWAPRVTFAAAWICMVVAIAGPLLPDVSVKESKQTRDFVINTDISGSMDGEIKDPDQQAFATGQPAPPGTPGATDSTGQPQKLRRIDVAQRAILAFAEQRKGDRVAVLVFDDQTYYYWPFTDDLTIVKRKAAKVNKFTRGGTNLEGENGAIQGAIDHFKEASTAKTRVLILVTDGEASISQEWHDKLTQQLVDLGIKIYVLGIGEGWVQGSSMTQPLRNLVEGVGGTVIVVGDAAQMRSAFETINNLEKSVVEIERNTTYRPIYEYWLYAAIIFLVLFLISSALVREDA